MPTPAVIAQSTDIHQIRQWAQDWIALASERHTKMVQAQNEAASCQVRIGNQQKEIERLLKENEQLQLQVERLENLIDEVKELTG
jgi:peptidoglycan hydrolase CwlO-like protein